MQPSAGKFIVDSSSIAVRNRLIEGYLAQAPAALIGIGVLLILNAWYYSELIPAEILIAWLAFMLAGLAGYCSIVLQHRTNPSLCLTQSYVRIMAGLSSVLGLGWGVLACYAITQLSTTDSFFGVILATGVVGAATATNSALPITFKALALSALSPVILVMFFDERSGYDIVGFACLVYLGVMVRAIDLIHETLRRSIELGLTNAELIVSLEKQSNTDALTGLTNRRGLNRGFESVWRMGIAKRKPVGLVLCDVDYFKSYNDSLGHQAGDTCLEKIGVALRDAIRSGDDIVARYGGEEFAILMANSSLEAMQGVGERIRELVQRLEIDHPASSVANHVTISVGVSQLLPSSDTQVEQLLDQADRALYSAKAAGRNCVRLVDPELTIQQEPVTRDQPEAEPVNYPDNSKQQGLLL